MTARSLALALLLGLASAQMALAHTPVPTYAEDLISIQFPAPPERTAGRYQAVTASGVRVSVPARVYALQRGGADYRVSVAALAGTLADDPDALDHAVAHYRQRHVLALDTETSHALGASGTQLCGQHFGRIAPDGRLHHVTLFYNPRARLFYDIQSVLTAEAEATQGAEATRFQQSLALLPDAEARAPQPPSYPPPWQVVQVPDHRFSIRFPAPPRVEQGHYRSEGGVSVPATRYTAQVGHTVYRLTAAHLWETAADEPDAVRQASRLWRRQGQLLSDVSVAVGNGQCGRELKLRRRDGTLTRASIFFPSSQHRLFIVEVAGAAPGVAVDPEDDRRFRASFTLDRPE